MLNVRLGNSCKKKNSTWHWMGPEKGQLFTWNELKSLQNQSVNDNLCPNLVNCWSYSSFITNCKISIWHIRKTKWAFDIMVMCLMIILCKELASTTWHDLPATPIPQIYGSDTLHYICITAYFQRTTTKLILISHSSAEVWTCNKQDPHMCKSNIKIKTCSQYLSQRRKDYGGKYQNIRWNKIIIA